MTGCLYVSPRVIHGLDTSPVVPVFLADTMVSLSAPHFDRSEKIIPSNVTSSNYKDISSVSLMRKLHIVDSSLGSTAVTFAGDGSLIRECLETLKWNINEWELHDRPMRKFGDNVNLYGLRVEAMAVYKSMDKHFNTMVRGPHFTLPYLGLCGSIGSGDGDLADFARQFDRKFSANENVYQNIHAFANSIAGTRLARELTGQTANQWGGFIEYVLYDRASMSWSRGPKSLHLFYAIRLDDEVGMTSMVPRAIAYDPGPESGRILSVSVEQNIVLLNEYKISGQVHVNDVERFWRGWKPDYVTINFIMEGKAGVVYVSAPVRHQDLQNVIFSLSGNDVVFGLEQDYLNTLAQQVIRRMLNQEVDEPMSAAGSDFPL